jgi:hypothetical protein
MKSLAIILFIYSIASLTSADEISPKVAWPDPNETAPTSSDYQDYLKYYQEMEQANQAAIKTLKDFEALEKARWDAMRSYYEQQKSASDYLEPDPEMEAAADSSPDSSSDGFIPYIPEEVLPTAEEPAIPRFIVTDVQLAPQARLNLTLENKGDLVAALVSIRNHHKTIIAQPYFCFIEQPIQELTFKLLEPTETITIQIETNDTTYDIPIYLKQLAKKPTINAVPFHLKARIGDSAEYTLIIEGSPDDNKRYELAVEGLPEGISYQIVKENQHLRVSAIKFSKTVSTHNLKLIVTLSNNIDADLLNTQISFTLKLSDITETLFITPIGLGKLLIDAPAEAIIPIGQSESIPITIENIGLETLTDIRVVADDMILGISVTDSHQVYRLQPGETKRVNLEVTAQDQAQPGTYHLPIYALSKSGRVTAEIKLEITHNADQASMFKPSILALAIIISIGVVYWISRSKKT